MLYHQDNTIGLRQLRPNSVDLIIADGPYFRIMKEKSGFDFQFRSIEEFQLFYEEQALLYLRALKPTGSLFVYGDARNIAYLQVVFDKYFYLLNNMVWEKIDGFNRAQSPSNMRRFNPITERILFYGNRKYEEARASNTKEMYNELNEPIRLYLKAEIERYGIQKAAAALGVTDRALGHWIGKSQFYLPSLERYQQLQKLGICKKPYQQLHKYKYSRELERFYYNPEKFTDVIKTRQQSDVSANHTHPTQKPPMLTKILVETTTQEGDMVVIPFVGSGSECVVCEQLERNWIGYEVDKTYYLQAKERIAKNKRIPEKIWNERSLHKTLTKNQ